MSIRPQVARVLSTSACSSSLRETLHGCAITGQPWRSNSVRTASQASALRLETTTLAPARAIASAIDLPMPRVEPVTKATLPCRSNGDGVIAVPSKF